RQQAQRDILQARLEAQKVRLEFDRNSVRNIRRDVELCPRRTEVRIPEVSVQVPDVQAQVDAAMKQVKVLKSWKGMARMQGMEALQNLPDQTGFDFSGFSNMDFPQGAVQMETRREVRTDGEGPI